jgi:hypothetical protein
MTSRSDKEKKPVASSNDSMPCIGSCVCGARGLACFHFNEKFYRRLFLTHSRCPSFSLTRAFLLLRLPLLLHKQQLATFFLLKPTFCFLLSPFLYFIQTSHYHTEKHHFAFDVE